MTVDSWPIEKALEVMKRYPSVVLRHPQIVLVDSSCSEYLRIFLAQLVSRGLKHINKSEKQPAAFYFHPWKNYSDQSLSRARLKSRFRHYLNLDQMEGKICYLLENIKLLPIQNIINHMYYGYLVNVY